MDTPGVTSLARKASTFEYQQSLQSLDLGVPVTPTHVPQLWYLIREVVFQSFSPTRAVLPLLNLAGCLRPCRQMNRAMMRSWRNTGLHHPAYRPPAGALCAARRQAGCLLSRGMDQVLQCSISSAAIVVRLNIMIAPLRLH